MGCGDFIQELKEHVPILSRQIAFILFFLNLFIPGFGTILLTCFGGSDNWIEHLLVGLIQFFSFPLLIGWIWSFAWGIYILHRSAK